MNTEPILKKKKNSSAVSTTTMSLSSSTKTKEIAQTELNEGTSFTEIITNDQTRRYLSKKMDESKPDSEYFLLRSIYIDKESYSAASHQVDKNHNPEEQQGTIRLLHRNLF